MALEAGETMHQVYAAVRIWQIQYVQKLPKHAYETGCRIFGKARWDKIIEDAAPREGDEREHCQAIAFATLHSSEWYDDPNDTVRTMSNMEMSAILYIDERMAYMDQWPIYVEDKRKPKSRIGIEQTFDVVLEFSDKKLYRYVGTIDGLVMKHGDVPYLDENKTASRIDDGWRLSFDMKHQITGYCAASTTVFGFPVFRSRVTGCKIKPTHRGEDVHVLEPIERNEASIRHWANWLRHTADMYESYKDDYEHAPRYTHSCNRYFRPCSLLPFCGDTPEGRSEQFDQMQPADLSPSEKAVQEL